MRFILFSLTCDSVSSRSHHSGAAVNNTSRLIVRKKVHPSDCIGLTLVGGNAVGIFVRDVMPGSLLDGANGVQCGDQILQVLLSVICLCIVALSAAYLNQ